ncbi:hypothetical protein DFH09DRAFT_1327556 [Mycena vulgaris]|nr:hypothetical protein DFH09DRAFT_1327556 [Mycena vulgaris]
MHENACCVLGIHELLGKALPDDKKTEDDACQGPILRAALRFLSAPRSDEEHAALREHLLTCNCKPGIRAQHKHVYRPLPEVLESAIFHICSMVSDYFMRIGAGKFRKVKSNTSPEAQPWPSCISDVIPASGGEGDDLAGLVQWAAHVPEGHSIFALVSALARYWEPFAMRLFQAPEVFLLATQHLQRALDSYDACVPPGAQMMAFIAPVIACVQGLFGALSEVDMRCTISMIAPVYEQMYAIAVAMEPILLRMRAHMSMDDCRRWFHLVRTIRSVITPNGSWIRRPGGPPPMEPHTHYGAAFHRMVEIRNRNQCLHVACTSKIQERSSVCSRCGIVRYCSRECLEAAWLAPRIAHKTLCKQITALRAAMLLRDDKVWANVVRDSQVHRSPEDFADMCVRLGADVRGAEAIWRGIMLLTDEKLKFADKAAVDVEDEQWEGAGKDGVDAGPLGEQVLAHEATTAPPVEEGATTGVDDPLPDEDVA